MRRTALTLGLPAVIAAAAGLLSSTAPRLPVLWAATLTAERSGPLRADGPDFNGDGFADLAVGVPLEDVMGVADGGAVNVLYGSDAGITSANNSWWSQATSGVDNEAEQADQFGTAVAAGDFNADGFDDMAVGVPYETLDAGQFAGYVYAMPGSANGLTTAHDLHFTQDAMGILDNAEPNDLFGYSLATGDFDGDGFADLAVGVPFEKVGADQDGGAVNVLYGSRAGLTADGNQYWNQDTSGIADGGEPDDSFGLGVTAGDVNGDGVDDLIVPAPFEDVGSAADAGAFHVILGSPGGLTSTGSQFWTQNASGILDTAEADDLFGYSATSADFNGDGIDDVAVGVESENVGSVSDAGAVSILFGSAGGLTSEANQYLHQDSTDVPSTAETQDYFGISVAGGDFDGDGFADLAVGSHREDLNGFTDPGGLIAFYGSSGGLTTGGSELWHQDSADIKDGDESYDLFGYALAAANFGNGPEADLAVGVVLEDNGSVGDGGALNVIFGAPGGLTAAANQYWNQNSTGVADSAEVGDEFGYSIATGPA